MEEDLSQKYVDKITLEYLGGQVPKIQEETMQKTVDPKMVSFYKKRLYGAIKQHLNDLIKHPANIEQPEDILASYIDAKMKAFRIDDFADLQEYDISDTGLDTVTDTGLDTATDTNIDAMLYKKKDINCTLDDFVIKKTIVTAMAPNYPKEKDLMAKNFRYKGIKKRM